MSSTRETEDASERRRRRRRRRHRCSLRSHVGLSLRPERVGLDLLGPSPVPRQLRWLPLPDGQVFGVFPAGSVRVGLPLPAGEHRHVRSLPQGRQDNGTNAAGTYVLLSSETLWTS